MLVLSRKLGEKILIGNDTSLTVLELNGSRVRIGIDAPDDIRLLRHELAFWQDKVVDVPEDPAPTLCSKRKRQKYELGAITGEVPDTVACANGRCCLASSGR